MSRLYLIGVYFMLSFSVFTQTELKKYLEYAQEKFQKGDYLHALNYYEKALKIDSSAIHTLWNYAEALRAYKDYRKAEYYYGEIFKREGTELFKNSLLYYGLMQKQNGNYEEAIETFKMAKKVYRNDKKAYVYLKCKREFESCLWALSALKDTADYIKVELSEKINSKDAEFGHLIVGNELYFSSLKADSTGLNDEVYANNYKTQIYSFNIRDSIENKVDLVSDLVFDEFNTGNGTFSLDGTRFYFSLCSNKSTTYLCKIMVANFKDGKFKNIDSLGSVINYPGSNVTMPSIGEWNGNEVLFFSSDRPDGKGGMDLWYSEIIDGNQYKKPQNIKTLNSVENELNPHWDEVSQTLFYSSTWENGFGGYDIQASQFIDNAFAKPQNVGIPFNSPANDLYYFQTPARDTFIVSSNRLGTNYSKNPTCCSDVFMFRKEPILPPPSIEETFEELNKRLPLTLYFHNDIPNPDSWDTVTSVNYIDSYNDYTAMLSKYKKEYSKGLTGDKAKDAEDDIEDFFMEYVDQGVKDLNLFRDLLLKELQKGRKIQLTVKGFASPLAKTNYNVNLTKRRIWSLINYLQEYENGIFKPYFDHTSADGGYLTIEEVPFGEYTANQLTSDNPNDEKNSIYSRAAAIERKIEVQSVSEYKQIDTLVSYLSVLGHGPVYDAGDLKRGEIVKTTFRVLNSGSERISIDKIEIPCDCITVDFTKETLNAGEIGDFNISFNSQNYSGLVVKSATIFFDNDTKQRLVITSEVKP